MKQHLQISIPDACSQNWDTMSPTINGKYCSSCQKQVIDFSNFNNSELQEWFRLHADEKNCGRLTKSQLMPHQSDGLKMKPLAYLKTRVFIASLLALPVTIKASTGSKSVKAVIEASPFSNTKIEAIYPEEHSLPADTARKLKGIILESDGKTPAVAATVQIKGTNKQVQTNVSGNFEIDLSGLDMTIAPILVIEFIGFETIERKLDMQSDKPLRISMVELPMLGEICIKRHGIFRRIVGHLLK